jgi:hypothetical protein
VRRAILFAALLAAGCDDDSLPAKVANAQLHGIVAAEIHCPESIGLDRTTSPFDTAHVAFHAQRLLDGSCLVRSNTLSLTLLSRSNPDAETCSGTTGSSTMYVEDGVVVLQNSPSPLDRFEGAVGSVCTGFGFESFGVE